MDTSVRRLVEGEQPPVRPGTNGPRMASPWLDCQVCSDVCGGGISELLQNPSHSGAYERHLHSEEVPGQDLIGVLSVEPPPQALAAARRRLYATAAWTLRTVMLVAVTSLSNSAHGVLILADAGQPADRELGMGCVQNEEVEQVWVTSSSVGSDWARPPPQYGIVCGRRVRSDAIAMTWWPGDLTASPPPAAALLSVGAQVRRARSAHYERSSDSSMG